MMDFLERRSTGQLIAFYVGLLLLALLIGASLPIPGDPGLLARHDAGPANCAPREYPGVTSSRRTDLYFNGEFAW